MGNCLAIEAKVMKIIKKDGEVLQYDAPLQVQDALADFEGHALSASPAASHHLQTGTFLQSGRPYRLLPLSLSEPETEQQRATFISKAETETGTGDRGEFTKSNGGRIRIKLVLTKQQLADILNKGFSVEDVISGLRRGIYECDNNAVPPNSRGWAPALRSIPEASDEPLELPEYLDRCSEQVQTRKQ